MVTERIRVKETPGMVDAIAYSQRMLMLMPVTFPQELRPKITCANVESVVETYKTLIPIKKKRKTKNLKRLFIYLIKNGHRNHLKIKGRKKQKNKIKQKRTN